MARQCVRLSPPRPAISSLRRRRHRVIDGDIGTACASTSAAISPAGPAPMTATAIVRA